MADEHGYTPEGLEDAKRKAYMEVLEIFRPFVMRNMVKRIEEEVVQTSFTDQDMLEYCLAIRRLAFKRYGSAEVADRHMREASRRFLSIEAMPADTRSSVLCTEEVVDDMFDSFVSSWLDVLHHLMTGEDPDRTLDASVLGLDMLPGTLPVCKRCKPGFQWTVYGEAQARQMLRFVRSSLSNGKLLPDKVVELLSLHGITVINLE